MTELSMHYLARVVGPLADFTNPNSTFSLRALLERLAFVSDPTKVWGTSHTYESLCAEFGVQGGDRCEVGDLRDLMEYMDLGNVAPEWRDGLGGAH